MSKEAAQFVFMTCRPGAEPAVKQEVARTQPAWRLSFSRPGFLTFKQAGEPFLREKELAERSWTFAHAHGVSLGSVAGTQLAEMAEQVWRLDGVQALVAAGAPLDVHVWQREPAVDDVGEETLVTPLATAIEAAVRASAPENAKVEREVGARRRATPRHSCVLDIVLVDPNKWWIGSHSAIRRTERWPGGAIPVRMPAEAVSRAYLKMQEALEWSDLPLAADDECVEIGCAPGGATQALLDRGLFVTGIDPADVDPTVLERPRFRHLKKRGGEVRRKEFVGVRWLAADMNIAPDDTLAEVEAIVTSSQLSIRGMVLTLKFSDWKVASRLPEFVERVHGWGYRDVRTRQLVTGGQEVCLVALRRKALRRLGGKRRKSKKPAAAGKSRTDQPHSTPPEPHF
jgi:23S rRNA (cytidine2498-2'-O)-methyltransferase